MTTTTPDVLIQPKFAEAALFDQYTSTNVATAIDKFTATNTSALAAVLTVHQIPAAGTAGTSNSIQVTIQPGRTYTFGEIVGHMMQPGDKLATLAGTAAAIWIKASGRKISA